jgi:hypothetical protein
MTCGPARLGAALALALAALDAPAVKADRTAQADAIVWSASRRLTWDDFKAKPVRQLDGARSALNYSTAVGCRSGRLHVRVLAVFLPDQSSVTYRITSSGLASRVGLDHEQVHFDLAEVYARRVRRVYAELPGPCPRSDDALSALAEPIFRDAAAAQRRLDDETRFGELEARQIEWAARVARDLAELDAFQDRGSALIRDR